MSASQRLSELLKESKLMSKDLAQRLGVDPSMITKWTKGEEKIPHARVAQLVSLFDLGYDDADLLMGIAPLEFYYRTRNNRELEKSDVSEEVRARTNFIYEAFVKDYMEESKLDLTPIREELRVLNIQDKDAYKSAVKILREHFFIPPNGPISRNFVQDYIIEELGINCYYMSFKSIGIDFSNGKEEDKKAAILFARGSQYGVLIDADRNLASAFFDLLHEILHVLIGKTFERNHTLEHFIDKVVGELIYPESFLKGIFCNSENDSAVHKNSNEVIRMFVEKYSQNRTWSPAGLAKAFVDYGMTETGSQIYLKLTQDFYTYYKEQTKTLSQRRNVNVEHGNFEEHRKLFENVVLKEPDDFPVYINLRSKLISGEIAPQTYSKLFNLSLSHVKVLKSLWGESEIIGELESWPLLK